MVIWSSTHYDVPVFAEFLLSGHYHFKADLEHNLVLTTLDLAHLATAVPADDVRCP
jgi:hypothetical protein